MASKCSTRCRKGLEGSVWGKGVSLLVATNDEVSVVETAGNSEVSSSSKGGTVVLEWRVLSEGVTMGLVRAVDCRPRET